jgi:hypothetical protein
MRVYLTADKTLEQCLVIYFLSCTLETSRVPSVVCFAHLEKAALKYTEYVLLATQIIIPA